MAKNAVNARKQVKVYAIGNLTLDIVASHVHEMPGWGTEISVENLLFRTAGNLGNFCQALAAMGLKPRMIGNVGKDREGAQILEELAKAGLDTRPICVEEKARTSVSITVVKDDGERVFFTFPGQLELVTRSFLQRFIARVEKGSLVILCSLFQLPNLKLDEVAEIASALKRKECTVLADPGWDPKDWKPDTVAGIRRLLPSLDYFLPNIEEAGRIAGAGSEAEILGFFRDSGAANVIIKKGASGCVALLNGQILDSRAFAAAAVDSTGAGDVFNAALTYCLANNVGTQRLLDFANAAASLSIAKPTNRYPRVAEIEAAMAGGSGRKGAGPCRYSI